MQYDDEGCYDDENETVPIMQPENEEAAGTLPALPSLALGGATLLTVGGFDLLAHLGPTGLLVGGIAAIIAARHGTAIIDGAKTWLNLPASAEDEDDDPQPRTVSRASRSRRSLLDRALGHFPEDEADVADEPPLHLSQTAPATRYDPVHHRDCLYLGPSLSPHANTMLSKRIAILGMPGSGKSNALAVVVEALGKLSGRGVPFILGDTDGEYRSLCSRHYLLRPVYAHAGNLTPENAFQFGQQVLEQGLQVILNLQSYEENEAAAALVMIELIRGLRAWEESHENEDRLSCMFLLDEATVWLPQRAEESLLAKERDETGRTLLSRLQRTFFSQVARRGRRQGIGFLFATQRPADLDKRCLSCDWYILFRQTLPTDLKPYAELGVPKDVAMALSVGEAWVIDPAGRHSVQQFRQRSSPDAGKTPGLSSLHQHAARWHEMGAGELPPMPPLPMREVPVTPESTPVMQAPARRGKSLLERGIEVYLDGATSQAKLAVGCDISPWEARQLMPKVQAAIEQMQQQEQEDEAK